MDTPIDLLLLAAFLGAPGLVLGIAARLRDSARRRRSR